MLKQVTARNWRAFDAVEIGLQPGLNILLGPNGAGKTSLLEAAAFALAGAPSTLPDPKLMVRADGKPVDVAVALELDGASWEVSRALGPAGRLGAQALRCNGATRAEGGDGVAAALADLLGVPCDFYLRILYMPEGDVYRFLTNPPLAALDQHLRRVLGLEQLALIERAAVRAKSLVADDRARLTPLEEQVEQRSRVLAEGRRRWSGDPTQRQRELEAERERLEGEAAAVARARQEAADAAHAAARKLAELEKVEQELATLQAAGDAATAHQEARADAARLETEVRALDQELADATARQEMLAERRRALAARGPAELAADDPALEALLAEADTARGRLEAEQAAAAAERQAAAERERALRARRPLDLLAEDPALQARRDERAARLQEIAGALAAAAAERQNLAESTRFLADHAPGAASEATCPVCRQPLPEALRQRLLAENAARAAALAQQVAALEAERADALATEQAEAEALQRRLLEEAGQRAQAAAQREAAARAERAAQAAAVQAAVTAARERLLAAHDADARELGERVTALRAQRQAAQTALEDAERREGVAAKARQRLDALAERRRALLPGDATLDDCREEQARLDAAAQAAQEREAALSKELDGARQEIAELQAYLKIAAMAGRSPEDLAAAGAALARRELLAELFADATKATLVRLQQGALAEAYADVARAWEAFSGWSGARLEPDPRGKRLGVRRDGRVLDLAQLSGGERAAFLALLHAHLGQHFGRGGFLLLDEPLEHLDAENGRKLLQHLVRACAEGELAQVVIATVEADVVHAAIRDGEAHVINLPLGAAARA